MTHDEGYFEMLTALGVAGQLTEGEFLELEQHASQCLPCIHRITETEAASRQLFLFQAHTAKVSSTPAGMRERFLMRAVDAGILLKQPNVAHGYANAFRFASVAFALVLALSASWNAVFETNATTARRFIGASNASIPLASHPAPTAANETRNSSLSIRRPGKKQHPNKRPAQMRSLASSSSFGSRSKENHFFTTTASFVNGVPAFDTDYFISAYDRQRKLQLSNFSAATLWQMSEQKELKKRVFDFSATLAPLSFLSYQSNFRTNNSIPDLSIHDAIYLTRVR